MPDVTYNPDGKINFHISPDEIKEMLHFFPVSRIKEIAKKNDENKIGILIAIKTEQDDEKKRVENDLINALNNFLNSKNLTGAFNIIVLGKSDASKIDNTNWSEILVKKKAHLIIYGMVTKRSNKGINSYSLKLEAGVVHKPIPVVLSRLLSNEFAQLFPRERYFPVDDELLGFEVTTEWLGLSVEYMIGVAFYVSGNFGPAFLIFNDLQEKLNNISKSKDVEAIIQLKAKVPGRLVESSLSICAFLYNLYSYKRDKNLISEAKIFLNVIEHYSPREKRMKGLESIYYVLVEEDIDRALKAQKEAQDEIKSYNLGFLYFMKDQISEGIRMYQKAFKREIPLKTLIELEAFIQEYINKYPDKTQLYFASAIVNYKGKGDLKLAIEDFKKFIKLAGDEEKYSELVRLSKTYVQELLRKIS
jgi:tetratricopeptide (TPR) repeat protein